MRLAHLVRLQWLLGTLLIVAAAVFAVGVATEGDVHDSHRVTESTSEAAEQGGAAEQEATRLLGVNLESTRLVVVAIGVSVALAAATWRTDRKLVLLATGIFAAGFAALDVAELRHQIEESAATIAVIAAIVALLHAAAALLAEQRRTALR